jgi:DNA invertase Pin-like site-specific DNA recombinase
MLSTVLAGIAEFERELIRERIGAHADLRNLWETADFQLDP